MENLYGRFSLIITAFCFHKPRYLTMKPFFLLFIVSFLFVFGHSSYAQSLSWSPAKGPYSTTVYAFDSAHGVLYAGTKNGLFQSTNNGALWLAVPSVPGIIYDVETIGGIIYTAGAKITVSPD